MLDYTYNCVISHRALAYAARSEALSWAAKIRC